MTGLREEFYAKYDLSQPRIVPPQSQDVAHVIRGANSSKALGPDGISMVMLKQLNEPPYYY